METVKLRAEAGWPYANSQYYKEGEYALHYRIDEAKGEEKAKMFMIHGFACSTALFDELVDIYTANGIKCVRVDLPDFGFSTREVKGIDFIPQTKMVVNLMNELDTDGKGWILLGHSMGGSVSLETASLFEDQIKLNAIILNCPMFMANINPKMGPIFLSKPMTGFLNGALKLIYPIDFLWKVAIFAMTFNWDYSKTFNPDRFRLPFILENSGTGLCYMSSKAHCPDFDFIKKIKAPVQLVTGSADLFVMPNVKKNLIANLPAGTDIRNVKMGGHCLMQDKADEASRYALAFLREKGLL